ncbi:MAG: hypothetical protein RL011_110, partial [Pseudomonadota bacterium]
MRVAVVGASGFVGRALIKHLLDHTNHEVIALSRTPLNLDHPNAPERYRAISCDLHNPLQLEHGLAGIDAAYYLVHSMLPGARLNQGSFADFDLSLADNFARTARMRGVNHVIYLSGLAPTGAEISQHLLSRLEVETTLRSYIPTVTCLRAGMIVGPQGSSFTMMVRLVQRLPLMVCPAWTRNSCQIVVLDDVVRCLAQCLEQTELQGRTFDLGAKPAVSYRYMLETTARLLGKKPALLNAPLLTIGLSRLWVSLVTGAPKDLVYPLISSLRESMLVRPDHQWPYESPPLKDFVTAAKENLPDVLASVEKPHAFRGTKPGRESTVRSIQRLPLPAGKSAAWVAERYLAMLPKLFPLLIKVRQNDGRIFLQLTFLPLTLLVLQFSHERSSSDRQLFYVVGGALVSRKNSRGRLELRETLGGQACLAAVHDF